MDKKPFVKLQAIGLIRRDFTKRILSKYVIFNRMNSPGPVLILFENVRGRGYIFSGQTLPGSREYLNPISLKLRFLLSCEEHGLKQDNKMTIPTSLLLKNFFRQANSIKLFFQKDNEVFQPVFFHTKDVPVLQLKAHSDYSPEIHYRQSALNKKIFSRMQKLSHINFPITNYPNAPGIVWYKNDSGIKEVTSGSAGVSYHYSPGPLPFHMRLLRSLKKLSPAVNISQHVVTVNEHNYPWRKRNTHEMVLPQDVDTSINTFQFRVITPVRRAEQSDLSYKKKGAPAMELAKTNKEQRESILKVKEEVKAGMLFGQAAVPLPQVPQVDVKKLADQVYQDIERRIKLEKARRGR